MERFRLVTQAARDAGIAVRGAISCAVGCPYEGKVAFGWVDLVTQLVHGMGVQHVGVADNTGVGTPLKVQRARGGFEALDTLSVEEKKWMAPLPVKYDANLPGYLKMKEMMGGHGGDNLPKAQAIKDATMAYFILKNSESNKLFMHYNGSYHSDNFEGIYWYLKQENANLKITTVSIVQQDNIKKINKENKSLADFILVVPTTMTKTY